jgi:methyl-accepting chemotaxis protein
VKIKTKIVSGFAMVAALLAVVAMVGYWGISKMNSVVDDYALTEGKLVESAQRSRANINQLRRYEKDAFINMASPEKVTEYAKKWQEGFEHCKKRFDAMDALLMKMENGPDAALVPGFKQKLKTLRDGVNEYGSGFQLVLAKVKAGEVKTTQEANTAIGVYKDKIHRMESVTVEMAGEIDKMMEAGLVKAKAIETRLLATIALISLGAFLLTLFLAFGCLRSILKPLEQMLNMVTDVAQGEGDLTRRLDVSSKDELADINRMFNLFIEKLHGSITQIAGTSQQVAATSTQLHATAEQIATGTEEVAAQSVTVATAGEEMTATSGEISQNCQFAAEGSQQANLAAVNGVEAVNEIIAVMRSIAEKVRSSAGTVEGLGARSDQIGEIVGTIEDIADQTNLLALNAAIEAARAGEQGRGFAVVADEVRALADRTTKATREISEMIKAIQQETRSAVAAMEEGVVEVSKGTEKAAHSGDALQEILDKINAVTSQIHQVATAAEEQTATTSEISNNMHKITEVVQTSSQGAAETAAAASDLAQQSDQLQRLVSQFKLA